VAIRGGGGIRVVFGDRVAECHVGMDEATYAQASAEVDALLREMAAHLAAEQARKLMEGGNG
jgi:hypothetical protein